MSTFSKPTEKSKRPVSGPILLFFPSGIGDVVRNLGIVNSIHQAYPDCPIDIAYTKAGTEKLLVYNTHVRRAIPLRLTSYSLLNYYRYFLWSGWRDVRDLNRSRYALVIATTMNPLRRFLLRFTRAHQIIALPQSGSSSLTEYRVLEKLGIPLSDEPFINNRAALASIAARPEIISALDSSKPVLVINMFCADSPHSIRDWDKWANLVEALQPRYTIILVGQAPFAYKTEYPLDYALVTDLINQTTMAELLYIIQRSNAVITIDSFIFHLTYALKKKVIGLFGPVDPITRIPPMTDQNDIITLYSKPACSPCITTKQINFCANTETPNICMTSISVLSVVNSLTIDLKSS